MQDSYLYACVGELSANCGGKRACCNGHNEMATLAPGTPEQISGLTNYDEIIINFQSSKFY